MEKKEWQFHQYEHWNELTTWSFTGWLWIFPFFVQFIVSSRQ